jgi:hypothetical protein
MLDVFLILVKIGGYFYSHLSFFFMFILAFEKKCFGYEHGY